MYFTTVVLILGMLFAIPHLATAQAEECKPTDIPDISFSLTVRGWDTYVYSGTFLQSIIQTKEGTGESWKLGTYDNTIGDTLYYTNGDYCDPIGEGRSAEIEWQCGDGNFEVISIDEPETCVYHLVGEYDCTCPTCDDGIQNQNETDVDCGGECPACPTCDDGIQNQNETDVDCGGSCPACLTPQPPTEPPTKKPPKTKPETCYNLRPKFKCRKILMSGRCNKPYWRRTCCLSCGGCGNFWTKRRCQKLVPQCGRNRLVQKRCRKACGLCK